MQQTLQRELRLTILAVSVGLVLPATALAQQQPKAPAHQVGQVGTTIVCESKKGDYRVCLADTSAGVGLKQATGTADCVLGKTWGYDEVGVWVAEGCSGEFQLGAAGLDTAAPPAAAPRKPTTQGVESWGDFEPGSGFLVGRSGLGELAISGYVMARYLNQMPGEQTFTDHLGNERTVDGRHDIYSHRIMVFLKGWLGSPKLIYNVTLWTVNTTDQRAIFAVLGYQFGRKFSLYTGLNGNPGTRSLQGSHPYWLAPDRVMADEFFRPFFTAGVWAQGELVPGLWYNAMIGDNSSILGVKATQLDRSFTTGASMWWMPTTKEFGPRGAYGDWEMHEKVATRFGFSTTWSPEERFTDANTGASGNTTIRLADSVNVFETGALAPGVTVNRVGYQILSVDAGLKYKGIFLQTEIYNRWLDDFEADGPLPVTSIHDSGLLRAGGLLPGAEETRTLRRDVADLRGQECGLQPQFRVPVRGELLSVQLTQPPAERSGH